MKADENLSKIICFPGFYDPIASYLLIQNDGQVCQSVTHSQKLEKFNDDDDNNDDDDDDDEEEEDG